MTERLRDERKVTEMDRLPTPYLKHAIPVCRRIPSTLLSPSSRITQMHLTQIGEITEHDTYPRLLFIRNPGREGRERNHGPCAYCNNFSCLALTLAAGAGPEARRAIRRPSTRSSPVTNSAVPTGRPVLSAPNAAI